MNTAAAPVKPVAYPNKGSLLVTKSQIDNLPAPKEIFGVDVALRQLLMNMGLPMIDNGLLKEPEYHPQFNYELHQDKKTKNLVYSWRHRFRV